MPWPKSSNKTNKQNRPTNQKNKQTQKVEIYAAPHSSTPPQSTFLGCVSLRKQTSLTGASFLRHILLHVDVFLFICEDTSVERRELEGDGGGAPRLFDVSYYDI